MLEYYGLQPDRITIDDLVAIVRQWQESVVALDEMLYADARKEFSLSAKTGFGFDGSNRTAEADFEQVRGAFDSNPFVTEVQAHIQRKSALGQRTVQFLESLGA